MKRAKRVASILVAFVLLLANMSLNVFAAEVTTSTEEYGQIILAPAEGSRILTPEGEPLESVLITLDGQEGYWYKVGERIEFIFEVEAGYNQIFESFNNANGGGGVDYDEEKNVYYGIVAAGENTIQTWTAVDDSYVGKNAISSLDNWQEKMFNLVGFASVVGNGGELDRYFTAANDAHPGTVFWFLNMSEELQAYADEDGNVALTYDQYIAIAEAYFVNAPDMTSYLTGHEYMNEETGEVAYYLGGLGDAWAWVLCDTEAFDGGYKLRGIFCDGPVEDTTDLTEYVDYYDGLYIDSAVELTVVEDAEHGWMIESYAAMDYYKAEDSEGMGEALYVYNEEKDNFSDVYYVINISQPEEDVKVVLEEGTYKTIDGMYCYSSDMNVKWKAECSEHYICQVKVERTFEGEVLSDVAEGSGVISGGGSVDITPIPVPLFTIEAEHAKVEVLQGLTDMGDGTYAYTDTAAVELKITPDAGYKIVEVASFLYDVYVVKGTYISASDSWVIYPESIPSTILVTTEEIKEETITITSGSDSAQTVTVQIAAEDAEKVDGLNLVVEELAPEVKEEAVTLIVENLGAQAEEVQILDIYFENAEGEETKVNVTMVVTVPVPEGWDPANIAVYYVNSETGEMVDMKAVVSEDGKYVSFTTNHFSHYALVQKAESSAGDAVPQPDPTVPQTGDTNNVALWGTLMAVAMVAAVVLVDKKRKVNR